jgi:hypothetical protein
MFAGEEHDVRSANCQAAEEYAKPAVKFDLVLA